MNVPSERTAGAYLAADPVTGRIDLVHGFSFDDIVRINCGPDAESGRSSAPHQPQKS